eukprot:1003504-Pleurochrysis_carterae.AAC.2
MKSWRNNGRGESWGQFQHDRRLGCSGLPLPQRERSWWVQAEALRPWERDPWAERRMLAQKVAPRHRVCPCPRACTLQHDRNIYSDACESVCARLKLLICVDSRDCVAASKQGVFARRGRPGVLRACHAPSGDEGLDNEPREDGLQPVGRRVEQLLEEK